MKTMRWFLFFSFTLAGWASTHIISIDATQMQAKVTVQTDQSGNCTYRASRGDHFTLDLPDLVDNGDTDARNNPPLIVDQIHIFVLGTRKGADALAMGATYWVGVTCGSDAEVSKSFSTLAIPWGNMAPDPVPFNPAKFGNMDYPVIDWSDQSKSYVDPISGVEFWRLTSPGMIGSDAFLVQYGQTSGMPIDLAGRDHWVNVSNAVYNGRSTPASFANAQGGASDKLFIPLPSNLFFNGANGWINGSNVDDILVNVYCGNASQTGITLSLQLTFDGGQTVAGTPATSAGCPTAAPAKIGTYPQTTPAPLFQGWGISPPQHNLVVPPTGTVSVSGSVVTLQSPGGSNNYFATEWVAGSPISINNTYYHIASVQSPTQLTIAENPVALTNVPYVGANFGIVVVKNGAGNVDVSLGLDTYGSGLPDNGSNGDVPMVNSVSVSVTKTANGLAALSPPLKGYLTVINNQGGNGSVLLWIPYNADGSPRNETRLLSIGMKPVPSPRVRAAGDTFSGSISAAPGVYSAFTGTDGNSWIAQSSDRVHVFRMTYDESLAGCAGYPAYSPYPTNSGYTTGGAAPADDCFQWTNLTPANASPPMDVKSQMIRGYQTGLNSLGESVGPAHPDFDLGWFGPPLINLTAGGYFTFQMEPRNEQFPDSIFREHLSIYASFDTTTGVLKMIKNMWGGDGDTDARWGGLHAVALMGGPWRFAGVNNLVTDRGSAAVLVGAFDLPVVQVNRAGYGAAPSWDSNTALTGTEAYSCPPDILMPSRYRLASMQALGHTGTALGGSTKCVQVKVSTPPCNATPNATYIFPDGKTEKDHFPCSTPGFGVADATRSKLMDLQPGDWMWERRTSNGNEQFAVLSVTYNGTNDIDIWLLRWARHNYTLPLFNNEQDDFDTANDARPNGWFLSMAPTFNGPGSSIAIDVSAGPSAKWLPDNSMRAGCHGVLGPGTAPGLFIFAEPCDASHYRGNYNVPVPAMLFQSFLPMGPSYPSFAGSNKGVQGGVVQAYSNNSWSFGAVNPTFQLDFRHLNPGQGVGPEYLGSIIAGSRTLTPVPGTSRTYLTTDSVSAGPSDYKRLPLYGFAGHYLLKDVSGPATGNTADLPDYSVCRALQAGECFANSAVGNLYVTVPQAYVDGNCRSNQFTLPNPCAFQLSPYAGQVIQIRTDKTDSTGLTARKLGYVHGMPGLQYQFSNCRATPEGEFAFCVADWLDGVRSEWVALRLVPVAPVPKLDSQNRTTFVIVTETRQGIPGASYIRALFGYAENGGNFLRCTAYQKECTTEIPVASPSDPYGFLNETVTRQNCAINDACTITIPAISQRMLYYQIERLDSSGNVVRQYPKTVVAVP